jgi:hypothetical protein
VTLTAEWEDDCQGKKDFDCEIIGLSTRYWPRGGGFHVLAGGKFEGNEARPEIKPSAKAHIQIDGHSVLEKEFEGETFEDVAAQVEAWGKNQHAKIVAAVCAALGVEAKADNPKDGAQ